MVLEKLRASPNWEMAMTAWPRFSRCRYAQRTQGQESASGLLPAQVRVLEVAHYLPYKKK